MKNIFKKINKQKNGYTIIETMIAVSLFIIIVMAGMGALLNANLLHQKSRDMRSILDNLSFVMEDMSRNLRVGYNYHCIDNTPIGTLAGTNTHSCTSGGGISFKSSLGSGQWVYYISTNLITNKYSIFKIVNGTTPVQLTPDEIAIDPASSFIVTGAEPPPDVLQPFVTIKLVGKITYNGVETPFSLQTSVSQRQIDI